MGMTIRRHGFAVQSFHHGSAQTSIADLLGIELPNWHKDAICAQTDPEAFFPSKGGSTREAKKICMNECPVREQCLEVALLSEERHGIWGGLSERERRKVVRERKRDAA